jgi:hypothetical protein
MTGFSVTPEDFHATGGSLEQAGGDLYTQWQQLKQQTLAIHFGTTDMVSPLIQMTLMGAVSIADSCFGTSKDALASHSSALSQAANHYSEAETNSSALFKAR